MRDLDIFVHEVDDPTMSGRLREYPSLRTVLAGPIAMRGNQSNPPRYTVTDDLPGNVLVKVVESSSSNDLRDWSSWELPFGDLIVSPRRRFYRLHLLVVRFAELRPGPQGTITIELSDGERLTGRWRRKLFVRDERKRDMAR